MHGIYDAMQAKGQTGPFMMKDGQLTPRPFQEYPKWVTKADGSRVVVKDIREEALMAGELAAPMAHDPLANEREALAAATDKLNSERDDLARLKADMRAQLDELATARAALQGATAKVATPTTAPSAPAGSTFRLPKEPVAPPATPAPTSKSETA